MATTPMSGDGDFRPKPVERRAQVTQPAASTETPPALVAEATVGPREEYGGFAPAPNFGHPETWE